MDRIVSLNCCRDQEIVVLIITQKVSATGDGHVVVNVLDVGQLWDQFDG